MTSYHLGQRLSFNDDLCTIRYCGSLPGQKGDWLGVEWDDSSRGKHDGHFKGKRLFSPLSPSSSSSSFIRPTRIADGSRTFLEALRFKYARDGIQSTLPRAEGSIEISGKIVEEIGFERVRKQQAILEELKVVVLDGLRIRGAGQDADVARLQSEIARTCPNILELDVSRNLFENWKDIAVLCAPLTKLRMLKAK
jgi:tubulin-specific chaperone E